MKTPFWDKRPRVSRLPFTQILRHRSKCSTSPSQHSFFFFSPPQAVLISHQLILWPLTSVRTKTLQNRTLLMLQRKYKHWSHTGGGKIKDTNKEMWWIFNSPCCLDFEFSLQHLTLFWSFIKKASNGDILGSSKWGWRVHLKTISPGKTCRTVHPTVVLCPRKSHPEPQRGPKPHSLGHILPFLQPQHPKYHLNHPTRWLFSCGDTRNSPAGHVCVSQRMTPLIAALLKSSDICGKNVLFQPQQPSALPGFQQVLNCCLSPALLLLTEDQTEFCHLWNPACPCSYTQPLLNSSEWSWHRNDSEARKSWGKWSETTLRFVPALVRRGRSYPCCPRGCWKANSLPWCPGVGHPDPETSQISLVPHEGRDFVIYDIVLLAKLRGFP